VLSTCTPQIICLVVITLICISNLNLAAWSQAVRPTILTTFHSTTVAVSQYIHLVQLLWNPLMEETTSRSILGPHLNHLTSAHAQFDLDHRISKGHEKRRLSQAAEQSEPVGKVSCKQKSGIKAGSPRKAENKLLLHPRILPCNQSPTTEAYGCLNLFP
jgi:hypothetical protein